MYAILPANPQNEPSAEIAIVEKITQKIVPYTDIPKESAFDIAVEIGTSITKNKPSSNQVSTSAQMSRLSPAVLVAAALMTLGGVASAQENMLPDSTLNGYFQVYNPYPAGYGAAAAGECIQIGQITTSTICPVSGNFTSPWGPSVYFSIDTVGLVSINIGNPVISGLQNIVGTFTATQFRPRTALSADLIADLRVGMPITTNDATPYAGVVTGWDASGGTYVTVAEWCQKNPGGESCLNPGTPSGTSATIGQIGNGWGSKVFGANFVSQRDPNSMQTAATVQENDCANFTGVNDPGIDENTFPYDGCLDLVSIGNNTDSFAEIIRGYFNVGIIVEAATGVAFDIVPTQGAVAIGLSVEDNGPNLVREALRDWTSAGVIYYRILDKGLIEAGNQGTTSGSYTWKIWDSGHGANNGTNPDATWTYSGGTGHNDGTVALSAGVFNLTGTYEDGGTAGVTCSGSPTKGFATKGGIVTHC